MANSDRNSADVLYEQVLDYARGEIEEAQAMMDELRQSLRQIEARVEAAQSIYNAVTARLNLEDEFAEEEIHLDILSKIPPVDLSAPEPSVPSEPEPEAPVAAAPEPSSPSELPEAVPEPSVPSEPEPEAPAATAPESSSPSEPEPEEPVAHDEVKAAPESPSEDEDSAISEDERTLIGEHLRSKRKG